MFSDTPTSLPLKAIVSIITIVSVVANPPSGSVTEPRHKRNPVKM